MNVTATLFVFLLVLAGVALLYFLIQQRLNDISDRLNKMQLPAVKKPGRSADDLRRDLASARDQLVVLEAKLVTEAREALSAEEIQTFELVRKKIKTGIEKLKQSGEWIGLPFDFEWPELQARLPRLDALYRRVVEAEMARLNGEVLAEVDGEIRTDKGPV